MSDDCSIGSGGIEITLPKVLVEKFGIAEEAVLLARGPPVTNFVDEDNIFTQ